MRLDKSRGRGYYDVTMKRHTFIQGTAALSLGIAGMQNVADAQSDPFDPKAGAWRTYVVTTTVALAPSDAAKV